MRKPLLWWVCCVLLLGTGAPLPLLAEGEKEGKKPSKDEAKAVAVVNEFLAALEARDVRRMAKVTATPWLDEGRRVLKDRAGLEKALGRLAAGDAAALQLQAPDDTEGGKGDLLLKFFPDRQGYMGLRAKLGDVAVRELFDQVVGKGDWAMFVGSKEQLLLRYFLVRVRPEGAKVVGGPYRLGYLLKPSPIPADIWRALKTTKELELFSLGAGADPKPGRDTFHKYPVLGKTAVEDAGTKKRLLAAFEQGTEEYPGETLQGAARMLCFNPRHAIRFRHEGKVFEFVICFECHATRIYVGGKQILEPTHAAYPQPAFDKVLRDAGVPLAKKREG